jgi:hypothetical protein
MIAPLLAAILLAQSHYRDHYPLAGPSVPDGLGVNVHFYDANEDIPKIAEAGFKWIRTDFIWESIERQPNRYNFSSYDRLLTALDQNHLHAILILDYGNRLYQDGAPRAPAARAAFVAWAQASMRHFRHRGIVWELYNEPNIKFWRPTPNVNDYIQLAKEVGDMVRRDVPDEWFIGPATSGIDFKFLDACLAANLQSVWDAVSVHPYRGHRPETALQDYDALRKKMEGHRIPIICSEWGYADSQVTEETQASYLSRVYLCSLIAHVPITIWYDWRNDNFDANAPDESHFGVVDHDAGDKEAIRVVRALTQELGGWKLVAVLSQEPFLYLLKFANEGKAKYVAWCWDSHAETLHIPPGTYDVTPLGGEADSGEADSSGLHTEIGPRPMVLSRRD